MSGGAACSVFGPVAAEYPHGVEVWPYDRDPSGPDCEPSEESCSVGALAGNGATKDGEQIALRVAGADAGQAQILRSPGLAFASETGDINYHEILTALPLGGRTLVFVAFWRDGDIVGEQETRAGYDVVLKSLVIRPAP